MSQLHIPRRRHVLALLTAHSLPGQIRELHTRDATRLSEVQLAAQLQRSDVIFIPVGAVEANGLLPSNRDYVSALGWAMAMAEESGGLYMPGLAHSFPGTTVVGSSTIYMSPSQGLAHLKTLARSLLRQGFRRQVWVSISHGPAALTVGTLARQFFEEERVPILYIDIDRHLPKINVGPEDRSRIVFGAHSIAGRLEDLPVQGDYGPGVGEPPADLPEERRPETTLRARLFRQHDVGVMGGRRHGARRLREACRKMPPSARSGDGWGAPKWRRSSRRCDFPRRWKRYGSMTSTPRR
jgi:hypothetical protein